MSRAIIPCTMLHFFVNSLDLVMSQKSGYFGKGPKNKSWTTLFGSALGLAPAIHGQERQTHHSPRPAAVCSRPSQFGSADWPPRPEYCTNGDFGVKAPLGAPYL